MDCRQPALGRLVHQYRLRPQALRAGHAAGHVAWRILAALGCAWALSHGNALAWGVQGHQVVAAMAQARLNPAARAEANRLLALEPGATLLSVSTWADEQRSPETAPWHYVNFPRGHCAYTPARDCPDGQCVVAAIEQHSQVLRSNAPDGERLLALKYVVHLVADVHQPLHAGHADDRGGNTYQLQAFLQGSNLHAVWDVWLIRSLHEDVPALAARLGQGRAASVSSAPSASSGPPGPPAHTTAGFSAARAAEESCHIVATPGFYPGRLVDADYLDRFKPVLEARLVLAGARLAEVLNRLLPR